MKPHYALALAATTALLATGAAAATFSADDATASTEFNSNYVAKNTINGSGLSAPGDPAATHATYTTGNHWTTTGEAVGAFIDWSFDDPQTLGGLYIWNHRSNNIATNAFYEPVLFGLTISDAGNNVLASFTGVPLAPNTDQSQAFSLTSLLTGVSTVRFTVEATENNNASTNLTGLAEVLFDDALIAGATSLAAPIPLPAGLPLLLAGMGGLALLRRRGA